MFSGQKNPRNIYLLAILSFILVGTVIYSNSLNSPFYFDDVPNVRNPSLMVEELTFESLYSALSAAQMKTRPVANLTFAINFYLHGSDVRGYHIVNIAIHIITAIFLFFFLTLTLGQPQQRVKFKNIYLLSYSVALLWLVHPLATQSVTYIVQRMNSLAIMFYLMAMVCYIKVRLSQRNETGNRSFTIKGYLLCALFGILALGSKEIAATLPIMILLYEIYFFQDLRFKINARNILILCSVIAMFTGLSYFFLGPKLWNIFSNPCTGRDFTAYERLLTQFRVIMHYISLIILPLPERLIFDYDFPVSTSLFNPISTFYSFISSLVLAGLAIITARKERLLSFCIVCFFLTLVIESSFICLEIIYEHRTYMPSMFLLLGVVVLLQRMTREKASIFLLLIPVIILFSYWTIQRNNIWQDSQAFWNDSLQKSPHKPRVLTNTGNSYFHNEDYVNAIKFYQEALSVRPDYRYALKNIGVSYMKLGQYDKAKHYIEYGLELEPKWVDMYNNLATIAAINEDFERAISLYRQGLHITPLYPLLNKNMGSILIKTGRPALAVFFLEQASVGKPQDIPLHLDLALAYTKTGKIFQAMGVYEYILSLEPDSVSAHYNLALLLTGYDSEQAKKHYEKVVNLSPYSVPALYNLANLLFRKGQKKKAKEYYLRVISTTPELANAYNNLGLLFSQEGKFKEAVALYQKVLQIMPDHKLARSNLEEAQMRVDNDNE